jgi:hypothetical protein
MWSPLPTQPKSPQPAATPPESRARTASQAFPEAHDAHQPPPALRTRPPTLTGAASLAPQTSLALLQLQHAQGLVVADDAALANPDDLLDDLLTDLVDFSQSTPDQPSAHNSLAPVFEDAFCADDPDDSNEFLFDSVMANTFSAPDLPQPPAAANHPEIDNIQAVETHSECEPSVDIATLTPAIQESDEIDQGPGADAKNIKSILKLSLSEKYFNFYKAHENGMPIIGPGETIDSCKKYEFVDLMNQVRSQLLEGSNPPHRISMGLPKKFKVQLESLLVGNKICKILNYKVPNRRYNNLRSLNQNQKPLRDLKTNEYTTFARAALVHAALRNGYQRKKEIGDLFIAPLYMRAMKLMSQLSASHQLWIYHLYGLDPSPPSTAPEYDNTKVLERRGLMFFIKKYEIMFGSEKTQTSKQRKSAIDLLPTRLHETLSADTSYVGIPELIFNLKYSGNSAYKELWDSLHIIKNFSPPIPVACFFNAMKSDAHFETTVQMAEALQQP